VDLLDLTPLLNNPAGSIFEARVAALDGRVHAFASNDVTKASDEMMSANADTERQWEQMYLIRDHVRAELQPDGRGLIGRRRLSFDRHRRASK
jgi:hypothetical protein